MKEHFGVPIIESFGMTETCSHSFTNPLFGEQRIGTVGLPSGIDARIESGNRLIIRGPCLAVEGWFDTGDLAEQDEAGYYRILGRSIDRINVRGYKLDPVSLENQLFEKLPKLDQVAVFGRDRVKCLYVGDYSVEQIAQALKEIGPYCWPSLVEQVADIPKNAAGKVSRTQLDSTY
jgi:long-chain acyl-CoA synthetase